MYRTHTCGALNAQNIGQEVTLAGWVNRIRNLGGLTFIDLRDRYGITQTTIDPQKGDLQIENGELNEIKAEFVLQITGKVIARPENMINPDMKTGEIEIEPTKIKIISTCAELPFTIDNENNVGEDLRLEYRYLDLRRKTQKEIMLMRSKIFTDTVKYFTDRDFVYLETPCFSKNTPEGSREYVVPARFDQGKFFVLPQSPQQYKQMLMVAGYDKYIQIAKCFRDEDPRGDRQPEFTQVDFELSFVEQEDILQLIQDYYHEITKNFPEKKFKSDIFPRLTRKEAMDTYGSDKPELRTEELGFIDVTKWSSQVPFSLFQNVECVKCLVAPKEYARSEIEKNLETKIKESGGKGLLYLIFTNEGEIKGPLAKFLTDETTQSLKELTKVQNGQTLFFQFGEWLNVVELLGVLRKTLIKELNLLEGKENILDFTFIVDFPLFEIGDDGSLGSSHHPFTKPKDEDIPYLIELADKIEKGYVMTDEDKKKLTTITSDTYDIIANGYENGGGSIRIHDQKLQHAIFVILGLTEEQIQMRFGHLLKCFSFGVPPHGGCAFGLDRMVMIYKNTENIREVIAFPKNQKYRDPMFGAPSEIDEQILKDLGLEVKKEAKKD